MKASACKLAPVLFLSDEERERAGPDARGGRGLGQVTTTTTLQLRPPYLGDRTLEKNFRLLARAVDEQLRGLLHRQISGPVAL